MYDVIVVGGGHAGIEACLAPARIGMKTLLITSHFENVGSLPCNTSIGGPAKGIIVREIDALGGQLGKTSDATYLQLKLLKDLVFNHCVHKLIKKLIRDICKKFSKNRNILIS